MKKITVRRKDDFNPKEYNKRTALDSDYSKLIKEDCKIYDEETGELIIAYFTLPKIDSKLLSAILSIKYGKNKRLAGIVTESRIFGYRPREVIRNDFCSSTMLSIESPKHHDIICNFAVTLTKYYKKYCGIVFHEHENIALEKIKPEWRIKDTPFSSGVVNKNNQLNYHHDNGNFPNVYSNMLALKSNISGGHLSIPEYDIGLEIANNSILLFDGQKILHGVTPIKKLSKHAYRYTLVYYTLKQMWKCEGINEEISRYRKKRTDIEQRRLLKLEGKIPNEI